MALQAYPRKSATSPTARPLAVTMKSIIKTILISFILLSCKAQDESIEGKLYSCIEKHYEDNNIDLDASLDSLENYLISKNILSSKDGEGKIKFYEDIIKNGEIPGIERIELMDDLSNHYYGNDFVKNCLFAKNDLDSLEYIETKFYKTSEAINNDVVKQGHVSPVSVSKAMLSHLTKEDFEKPIYRAHMLISFVMTADKDQAFIRQIPKSSSEALANDNKGFTIDLTTKDKLLINGKQFESEDLQAELLKYIDKFDESTYVRFVANPQTEYGFYSKIHSVIEMTYQKYWSQVALRDYKKEFSKLNSTEQNEIKKRYPFRIVETLNE
jgi:biopolymer transport protein ExbD